VAEYKIVDEPSRTPLSHLMTDPFWAVLGTMLGGVWLGWSWFVLNSLAIGSMHRKKEIATIVLGLLGSIGLTLLGLWAVQQGQLDAKLVPYAMTLLIAWKLAISYVVQFWQAPSYELAVYFRGAARNGALLAFAGMFLRSQVLRHLPDFWVLVLS
jgi:hypothetical protein